MEPLIGALSGLAVAVTGLAGTLWRAQRNGRNNGKHHAEEMRLLRSIEQKLTEAMVARAEASRQLEAHLSAITSDLAYLKGRSTGE